jgi:hypothetical protein
MSVMAILRQHSHLVVRATRATMAMEVYRMDHGERVQYSRNELDKACRDFPKTSTEVQAAEDLYQRALSAANCEGSPAVMGSDLSFTDDSSLHVAFYCDKVNVMTVFYRREDRIDRPRIFTAAEAVEVGQRIAETGVYEECPVQVSISAIKFFGKRLKEYGSANVR